MVRKRIIKHDSHLEYDVPHLARAILANAPMYRLQALHDRHGMAFQTARIAKVRKGLDRRADARVEALTELMLRENAGSSEAACANRAFLDWAVHFRMALTF